MVLLKTKKMFFLKYVERHEKTRVTEFDIAEERNANSDNEKNTEVEFTSQIEKEESNQDNK